MEIPQKASSRLEWKITIKHHKYDFFYNDKNFEQFYTVNFFKFKTEN